MKINDVLKKSLGATEIYSCIEHVEIISVLKTEYENIHAVVTAL